VVNSIKEAGIDVSVPINESAAGCN